MKKEKRNPSKNLKMLNRKTQNMVIKVIKNKEIKPTMFKSRKFFFFLVYVCLKEMMSVTCKVWGQPTPDGCIRIRIS